MTTPVVGMGGSIRHYSDCQACTVIACTDKRVTVQLDTAILLNGINSGVADALVQYPGGFAAHTSGVQRWEFAPNPAGDTQVFTLRKNGQWVAEGEPMKGGTWLTIGYRHHHYDFNF